MKRPTYTFSNSIKRVIDEPVVKLLTNA